MKVSQINNTQFKAVNQKYLERAKKEIKNGGLTTDWLFCLEFDVYCKDISPQDGIDTIEAMKKFRGRTNEGIESTLKYIKNFLRK